MSPAGRVRPNGTRAFWRNLPALTSNERDAFAALAPGLSQEQRARFIARTRWVAVIIMAVMANTMAMTARERGTEYATLKALGFGGGFVALLIFGESLLIAAIGGVAGIALTFPLANAFREALGTFFPIFYVSDETVGLQLGAALVVGVVAAVFPAWRASRLPVVEGLRAIA